MPTPGWCRPAMRYSPFSVTLVWQFWQDGMERRVLLATQTPGWSSQHWITVTSRAEHPWKSLSLITWTRAAARERRGRKRRGRKGIMSHWSHSSYQVDSQGKGIPVSGQRTWFWIVLTIIKAVVSEDAFARIVPHITVPSTLSSWDRAFCGRSQYRDLKTIRL